MVALYPSLIDANFLTIGQTMHSFDPYCAGYHIDIMDNHFVPNLTWGPRIINSLATATDKQMWIHLMVDNPLSILEQLTLAPQSIASFHIETKADANTVIKNIVEKKWLPSIAISPKTDIKTLFPFLGSVYQVLIMSVEPGRSGQPFLPSTLPKIQELLAYKAEHQLPFSIGIDGGVTEQNLASLAQQGVTQCAVGSAIFGATDPLEQLKKLASLESSDQK